MPWPSASAPTLTADVSTPSSVQTSDDCVDVVDPVVDDMTLARLAWIARHDREHHMLVLLRAIELAVVKLDVIGALVGEVTKLPTEMAVVPLRQRAWIARASRNTPPIIKAPAIALTRLSPLR